MPPLPFDVAAVVASTVAVASYAVTAVATVAAAVATAVDTMKTAVAVAAAALSNRWQVAVGWTLKSATLPWLVGMLCSCWAARVERLRSYSGTLQQVDEVECMDVVVGTCCGTAVDAAEAAADIG